MTVGTLELPRFSHTAISFSHSCAVMFGMPKNESTVSQSQERQRERERESMSSHKLRRSHENRLDIVRCSMMMIVADADTNPSRIGRENSEPRKPMRVRPMSNVKIPTLHAYALHHGRELSSLILNCGPWTSLGSVQECQQRRSLGGLLRRRWTLIARKRDGGSGEQ